MDYPGKSIVATLNYDTSSSAHFLVNVSTYITGCYVTKNLIHYSLVTVKMNLINVVEQSINLCYDLIEAMHKQTV